MENHLLDYYAIFGLSQDADEATIKRVFLEKARLLVEAYQTLTDATARAEYDLGRSFHAQTTQGEHAAFVPIAPFASLKNPGYAEEALKRLVVSLDGRAIVPGTKINKRLLSRIPVNRSIALRLQDGTWHEGRLKDLSGSGARVAVKVNLLPNDMIEIGTHRDGLPFVQAQVVRVVKPSQEFGVKWIQIFENELPKGFFSNQTF